MQILTHKICLFKIFIVPLHKKMTATSFPLCFSNAVIAQLVEHWLPKPRVAGSSPVYRSYKDTPNLDNLIKTNFHISKY